MKPIELTVRANDACREIFDDSISLYFSVKDNGQINIEFNSNYGKSSRNIIVSLKDSKKFIEFLKRNSLSNKEVNDYIYSFLLESKATYLIDWHSYIRKDKSFQLGFEEMEIFANKINLYLPMIFGINNTLSFSVLAKSQFRLTSSRGLNIGNLLFHSTSFKVNESEKFFKKAGSLEDVSLIIEIIKFLKTSNSSSSYNWDAIVEYDFESTFDKALLEKAEYLLKEHYESLYEIYLEDIVKEIDNLGEDKGVFFEFWKKYISPKMLVIEDIGKLEIYSKIKKSTDYPKITLSIPTASVSFSNREHTELLSLKINDRELKTVKNTENTFNRAIKAFSSYKKLKEHIDKHIQDLLLEFSASSYYDYKHIYNCEKQVLDGSIYYFDASDWAFILKNGYLFTDNLEFSINFIDRHFEQLRNTIISEFKTRLNKWLNSDSKDDDYFVLKAINDNSKKGITTYVSLLKGETSAKMKDYGYDKLLSYGKLNTYTKVHITEIIKKLVKEKLILEKTFHASFGSYTGLIVSEDAITYINNHKINNKDTKEVKVQLVIDNLDNFFDRFKESDNKNRKLVLIKSLKSNLKSIDQKDINRIIEFIKNARNLYRECETEIVDLFASITPDKYKPLFLLNSNLSTGVVKDTFSYIYDKTNEKSTNKDVVAIDTIQ